MNKKFDYFRIIFSTILTIILLVVEILYKDVKIGEISINFAIILPFCLILYVLMSYDLFVESYKNIKNKNFFNEVTLSLIATIAAFAIGEFVEALAVVVFFQIGEKFEEYALNKSRNSIKDLLDLRPDKVTILKEGKEETIAPFEANIGDLFIVRPGENVALDGVIVSGNSFIDTSSLTGESVPLKVKENDEILSGSINKTSPLIIKATKEFSNSTMSRILDIVENSQESKTKSERFISRFAKIYTPLVIIAAFIVGIIPPLFLGMNDSNIRMHYIKSAASLLVISCPCSIVLSIPMAYFVSLGTASKNNVLIKGSTYLEKFAHIKNIVLDKTGTITKGNFKITNIVAKDGTKDEILELAAIGEIFSNHPIALAIKENVDLNTLEKGENYEEIEGKGIKAIYRGKMLLVGNAKLLESNSIIFKKTDSPYTIIYVAYDNKFKGYIIINDEIKETSKNAISNFYKNGVKNILMLTGDNEKIAAEVAKNVGLNSYYASLLPLEKTSKLEEVIKNSKKNDVTVFIGDGINDAPSLIQADLGIAMGGIGSDITIESSDAVIMNDDLNKINDAIKISKKNNIVVKENLIFSLTIKFLVMIISFLPLMQLEAFIMWLAIFADVGVTIICVLNSLRLMNLKNKAK
ncbi:MAG: heavy metal translocating P-type ATPase [bacterium]|nr:heavy metal translocating P-type ATPase [bacterium]